NSSSAAGIQFLACLCTLLFLLSFHIQVCNCLSKFYYTDIRQVSVFLSIVQSISHYKLGWDVKAYIVYFYILHSSLRFIQKGAQMNTGRMSLFQDFNQMTQSASGVNNILNDQYILSLYSFIQIFYNTHNTAGAGIISIAGHRHKIKSYSYCHSFGQFTGKKYTACEHTYHMHGFPFIISAYLLPDLTDPPIYFFFA